MYTLHGVPAAHGRRHAVASWARATMIGLIGLVLLAPVPRPGAPADPAVDARFSTTRFEGVRPGMAPARVSSLLGPPTRTPPNLAEGLAWPEPRAVCWDYEPPAAARTFRVCFIAAQVTTVSSYLTAREEDLP